MSTQLADDPVSRVISARQRASARQAEEAAQAQAKAELATLVPQFESLCAEQESRKRELAALGEEWESLRKRHDRLSNERDGAYRLAPDRDRYEALTREQAETAEEWNRVHRLTVTLGRERDKAQAEINRLSTVIAALRQVTDDR